MHVHQPATLAKSLHLDTWANATLLGESLPESAADIILGPNVRRIRKQLIRVIELYHFAVQEEGGLIGNPSRLLHIVRDDDDAVIYLQLLDELFDL